MYFPFFFGLTTRKTQDMTPVDFRPAVIQIIKGA